MKLSIQRHSLVLAAVGLTVVLSLAGVARATPKNAPQGLIGHLAPSFTLKDFQNKTIQLSEYRGKVVLLNFWASWCAPCQAEMPVFVQWQKHYGAKLQVLGISMDDNLSQAEAAARRLKVDYPLMTGSEQVGEAYGGIFGLPETFLIDRQGKIRAEFQGGNHLAAIQAGIERLTGSKTR